MIKILAFLVKRQSTVGTAAFVLMIAVLISRILGLVRDRMLAARFAPDELGIYFAAFRLPNLIFELLVMGALTSAFIPVFTKYMSQKKDEEAWRIASTLINLSFVIFLFLTLPVFVWAENISAFIAPGFTAAQHSEMALYTRFMLFAQVVPLLIGNFFTGILQSFRMFAIPAIAPIVYNIGIILGIIFFTPVHGLWGPVIGVGIGALLFMFIQIPALIVLGYKYKPEFDIRNSGVREVGRLVAPRTIGLAISQIDTTVDLMLASFMGARMVTIFNFAQHLQYVPVGLFGATIGQAALPKLSESSALEDREVFKKTIISSIHQILFFVLPISVLFIVLRIPVVRLVFGASRFDWQATVMTGMTLSAFSLSLFAQSISHVLTRGFYALYDSKTPMITGMVSVGVNIVLSLVLVFVYKMPIWALALSTSVGSILHAGLLLILLHKRIGGFVIRDLFLPPIKMTIAAIISGIIIYIPLKLLDQLVFDTTRVTGLILLTGVSASVGLVTYMFLSWVLGVGEVRSFLRMLDKLKRMRSIQIEPAAEVVENKT